MTKNYMFKITYPTQDEVRGEYDIEYSVSTKEEAKEELTRLNNVHGGGVTIECMGTYG